MAIVLSQPPSSAADETKTGLTRLEHVATPPRHTAAEAEVDRNLLALLQSMRGLSYRDWLTDTPRAHRT